MFRKKEKQTKTYDRDKQIPVVRCSICTGEKVAGFKDVHTGKFEDIMLIRNDRDMEAFKKTYSVAEVKKEY